MDPRSEVLLRQAQLFDGELLLAGLPADDLLGALPQAQGWIWHAGVHARLNARFPLRSHFDTQMPSGDYRAAVLFLPKSRELADYLMQALASRLSGKPLYLVGEKRGGIERAAKQLAAYGKTRKLDNARHCQLWCVDVAQAPTQPDLDALAQHYTLPLADAELEIVTLPGVFAHGRLDRGSALLLEHLEDLPAGHLLDFGCGAGVLGAALKRRYPNSRVTLLDVDAFALQSSRLTLARNGLEADVIAGSGIESAPEGLSAIVSNPPFHQGVHTDYQASENLLTQATKHLIKGGELRLVANSFLKYPPLIERHLGPCRTRAEADGFRIYSARR
ncbi:Ribosomal RNA small subunit methyltransferase C [Pseudomonas sp. 8Z]|uniref:class I SAM-dependent methyltransferase n=1 Tax=Pseudomonas sp. 8Z TaxID=2653166 RepID=UPI0012F19351|nr:class I SAM-dependent methyltransferase [Pseudomonas sp. 8Z]VXC79163.1 Ribosomal RNA small subunit methyltransferase C [Pseudomonas sp. 8Z]